MQTLSAPEFNKSLISWEVLIPPPTVRGTKHSDEFIQLIQYLDVGFLEAVISNITISSTSHFTKNSIAVFIFPIGRYLLKFILCTHHVTSSYYKV